MVPDEVLGPVSERARWTAMTSFQYREISAKQ